MSVAAPGILNDGASGAAVYYAATFTVASPTTPYGLNGIVSEFANAIGEFDARPPSRQQHDCCTADSVGTCILDETGLTTSGQRFIRLHPRTAETSPDFTALELEPFLEPRAFWTWNRKQETPKKLH
jgi:hypothetical protein